jgi:Fur family peroxide stress response transcriptional regulator
MRYSKQREALLNILKSTKEHPTANDIYIKMREQDPKISLGTVYRNLKLLCDIGEAMALETADKKIHYDGCVNNHRHFICNKCGAVYDLQPTKVEEPEELLQKGFSVTRESCVFYGTCADCAEN